MSLGADMSNTFSLCCDATRQKVWVGQGHGADMTSFYSHEESTMLKLGEFLKATLGKPLVLRCDDTDDTHLDYTGD